MYLFSCFLVAIFFIFAFALPVPQERNSDALQSLDEALSAPGDTATNNQVPSATDDLDAGTIFKQPLLEGAQKISTETQLPSIPSTGSSTLALADDGNAETTFKQPLIDGAQPVPDASRIVADNVFSAGDAGNELTEFLLAPIFAGFGLLHEQIPKVNQVLQQDNPDKVKVTNIPFLKAPAPPQDGATTDPRARAKPETSAHSGGTASIDPCPPLVYKNRIIAWQDLGLEGSVKIGEDGILVIGFPFGEYLLGYSYQPYWCCEKVDEDNLNMARNCKPVGPIDEKIAPIIQGRY